MEDRRPTLRKEAFISVLKKYASGEDLTALLAKSILMGSPQSRQELISRLTNNCANKQELMQKFKTLDDFWTDDLKKAIAALTDKDYVSFVYEILKIRVEGQLSRSIYRRSYRSKIFLYYLESCVDTIKNLIYHYYYVENAKQMMYMNAYHISGDYEYVWALEIRRGNEEIISLIKDAIYGENSRVLLSRILIEAIIISGNDELINDLQKLLLAAKLQEGLRQNILEAADRGTKEVLTRFIKLCIDEDLFRFSSVIRAFDTWCGFGYSDLKPSLVKKCGTVAYECLTNPVTRKEYVQSEDNIKAYFAIWATGCEEIFAASMVALHLTNDPLKYRKILAWFFLSNIEDSHAQMKLASMHLDERDDEILAWVVRNLDRTLRLARSFGSYGKLEYILDKAPQAENTFTHRPIVNPSFPSDKQERRKLFDKLKEIALYIGNKKRTFTGNPFDFVSISLDNERVIDCMLSVAGYDMDSEMISELLTLDYLMTVDQKQVLINHFITPETNALHRETLYKMLGDRSIYVKEKAVHRLAAISLNQQDMDLLADSLRSKSSSLRKAVLMVLKSQPHELLLPTVSKMLESSEEYQIQAAIEILSGLKDEHPDIFKSNLDALRRLRERKISTQTEIVLNQLLGDDTEDDYTPENGYGLYRPQAIDEYVAGLAKNESAGEKKGFFSKLFSSNADSGLMSERQLKAIIPSGDDVDRLLFKLNKVFSCHADDEFEFKHFDGSVEKVLFGYLDSYCGVPLRPEFSDLTLRASSARLDMLPYYDEFMEALGDYATDVYKALGLYHSLKYSVYNAGSSNTYSWFVPFEEKGLAPIYSNSVKQKYNRFYSLDQIIDKLPLHFESAEVFEASFKIYKSMVAVIGEDNLGKEYQQPQTYYYGSVKRIVLDHRMLKTWRDIISCLELSDDDFAKWFTYEYRLEKAVGTDAVMNLPLDNLFRAVQMGIAPKDIIADFIINYKGEMRYLRSLTGYNNRALYFDKYDWAESLVNELVDRLVTVEEKRGEMPTPLTQLCMQIDKFEGAKHFCNLLAALGSENFFRGYQYTRDTTKQTVLSCLLKKCYPAKSDTAESLKLMLKKTDISENRLAEAVMYAPQWAGLAEEITGWEGLKCGVWFFHAHVNESFSAEKETETAIFSPISPIQFVDGAFDKNWFFEAYNKLGEKRFGTLYKSAKYITSGGSHHKRSQLYADAVLGKLDAESIRAEVIEKRNQERLRCYPLIPIKEGDTHEALRRYEFIQTFLKESKQFGAQRRESERKACATAMENLAITTGVMDVNRLMWQMESAKLDEIRPLMETVELDGVGVRIDIDENGDASIITEKAGKVLKTAPKTLAKNETFLSLKMTVKELKDLKKRSKDSLERAMIESNEFPAHEVVGILNNPILAPMVKSLVWISGGIIGFPEIIGSELILTTFDGSKITVSGALRIAHPHDMKLANIWADYMHLIYDRKLVQPFKQVFREYYPVTEDERQERTISRRYSGHQVQPKRTVALLKSRGWTVDYEEGLQKVFYKENLIVRMFALADWFSPSDIEAPTLETVEFFDRKTGENVPLEDIPPIIFSEAMRDIDLVVSVAHVGGVDPEASHSTVEMRTAIAKELATLLKLGNVSWVGSHAKIVGSLRTYSVHLGSGVVHAEGVGMVAILPVHSQARGRIFLPFADDDPQTAEIMSKIILLAEDKKLKDPSILSQLR